MLHVCLDLRIVELAADEALHIEDRVDEVHRDLVLRGVTDETLDVGERVIGRGGPVILDVGDNIDMVVLLDSDTQICDSEIDSNSF